jgi:alkylation response protein AidB-like acyl-CoA dehydrogenase
VPNPPPHPMTFDSLAAAERVAAVAAANAVQVDTQAIFPSAFIDACREAGLLALLSAKDVGGHGLGLRQAAEVIERVARECGSSAMVLTMHYAGTTVIEAHGPLEVRREIAAGKHLSTLAFSEAGSRAHFWAPVSTARADGSSVVLDARKSWITSANAATAYVWSSKPTQGSERGEHSGSCPRRPRESLSNAPSTASACAATTRRRWPRTACASRSPTASAATARASES